MFKALVLVALVVISLSVSFPFPPAMGQTTTLSVDPPGVFGILPGYGFYVDIVVSGVTDLFSWQFVLYYRSSVLNVTSVMEGPFLQSGGVSTFFITEFQYNYNATHGRMIVGCTRTVRPGVDGSGVLATIAFYAVSYGFSALHFGSAQDDSDYYTKLLDSAITDPPGGNKMPFSPIDGQAYVGTTNVAISSIDTPTVIPQGMIAYINVTGQNRGEYQATFDVTLNYNGTTIDGTQTIINLPGGESKNLTFVWDILLLPLGDYNLTATATTIPGEIDTSDNTLSILVHLGAADLAVTNVVAKTIVGQEYPMSGDVTVTNQGEFSATSNVTVYLNRGLFNETIIATFQGLTLAHGDLMTLSFTWNATILIGNYTLTAYIWPLPYETDTANNEFTSPVMIMVGIPGDIVSPFGVEDMKDIAYVAKRFGMTPATSTPSIPWDPNADFDNSGKIDMKDIAVVARNFGRHYP